MSLTEEARAPFSLVDEINQVCREPFPLNVNSELLDYRAWINVRNVWCTTQWST